MSLDPASLQILLSRLAGVAEEMSAVLRRAAFSPNIKERADCSAALFDAQGELLVQAEHIPVHLGSMPAAVAAAACSWVRMPPPPQRGRKISRATAARVLARAWRDSSVAVTSRMTISSMPSTL